MCSMRPATGARGTGDGSARLERGIGCPGEAEETSGDQSRDERFKVEQFVCEPQRRRVGKVVIIHRPAPVLYGIQLANGITSYAYDRDVIPATDAQIERYHEDAQQWASIRGSHRR